MKKIVIGVLPQKQIRARVLAIARYGLVDLRREKKNVRPIAKASDFQIQASA